jgi:hypothetical protein
VLTADVMSNHPHVRAHAPQLPVASPKYAFWIELTTALAGHVTLHDELAVEDTTVAGVDVPHNVLGAKGGGGASTSSARATPRAGRRAPPAPPSTEKAGREAAATSSAVVVVTAPAVAGRLHSAAAAMRAAASSGHAACMPPLLPPRTAPPAPNRRAYLPRGSSSARPVSQRGASLASSLRGVMPAGLYDQRHGVARSVVHTRHRAADGETRTRQQRPRKRAEPQSSMARRAAHELLAVRSARRYRASRVPRPHIPCLVAVAA